MVYIDLKYFLTRVKAAYQRARYGWAEWDIIGPGFDQSVMPAIGHQLIYLSNNLHGYPGVGEYNDPDKWAADLREHGQALIDGSTEPDMPKILVDHYSIVNFVKVDGTKYNEVITDEVVTARKEYNDEIARRHDKAAAALHWIADNYTHLWD